MTYVLFLFSKDSTTAGAACVDKSAPAWKSVPLPDASPGRRHNVARLRAMGGDPTCVPPDFNRGTLTMWEELWHSMPQSGSVSNAVNNLLQRYKERCRAERSAQDHHLKALQPCCLFRLHRPRIGCSSNKKPTPKHSRQVQ